MEGFKKIIDSRDLFYFLFGTTVLLIFSLAPSLNFEVMDQQHPLPIQEFLNDAISTFSNVGKICYAQESYARKDCF